MSLTPGTAVGPYEIVVLLGVGGMGEVYRARDGRLHRDVAIIPRYAFALISAGMGRDDEALRCLEEACGEQSPAVALWLGAEPRLDGLRSHRRFQELAEHVGVA